MVIYVIDSLNVFLQVYPKNIIFCTNLKRFKWRINVKLTIKDVAKASGVSIATASMALNDRVGVSAATKAKVCRIAREMNYVPDYSARLLVMQDSNCIGLLIPEIQNPFYSAIVEIITRIAEEKGFTIILGITNNNSRQEEDYVRMFLSRRVCGVIVVPMIARDPDLRHMKLLRAADIPIVFCTEWYKGSDEPLVMCDFVTGQYEATKYLIDKGLRDFWFVSTDMDAQFVYLRYEGYVKALEEAGIPINKQRELFLPAPNYAQAYKKTDLITNDLPEAIICINDIMTMAIMKSLTERGIRIPQDISIIGFDDIMFSELVSPPLTTVRQPLQEICEKTMEIMIRKLAAGKDHAEVERGQVHLIRPELIVRGTTI